MKRLKLFFLYCLILFTSATARANPIVVHYFSELMFDSTKWVLEIRGEHLDLRTGLDGWYLASKTDTVLFKTGLVLNNYGFYLITQDSLQNPLFINRDGDQILLLSPDSSVYDQFIFDNVQYSQIRSPKLGQSICLRGDCIYLDNTPTIGLPNDTLNAMGAINGIVTNSSGLPLDGAKVYQDFSSSSTQLISITDSSGDFFLRNLACRTYLWFERENYQPESASVQVYPESTVTVNITMDAIQAVNDRSTREVSGKYQLIGNYPNPFNPATTISYELPAPGQVTVRVYDLTGRLVKALLSGSQTAGAQRVTWDGTDFNGNPVAAGIYIYQIEFTGVDGKRYTQSKKMSLVR